MLPISSDEDPVAVLDGGVPHLDELRLHNGTIYRWNRPVYDISDDSPHLRVENRVLPAGPTVVDTMANAAFFAGLVRALATKTARSGPRCRSRRPKNFVSGIRHGIKAEVYWPQVGQVHVAELVVRKLLPLAAEGLRQWEADEVEIGRLLDIIEHRCLRTANGATWQVAEVARREQAGESREDALRGMVASYLPRMPQQRTGPPGKCPDVGDDAVPSDQARSRIHRAARSIVAGEAQPMIVVGYSAKPEDAALHSAR